MSVEGMARLLAASLAADGIDPDVVATDDLAGAGRDEPSRADRLVGIVERLRADQALDDDVPAAAVRTQFAADDDRWAGWRDDEPLAFPATPWPDRAVVVRALRRLPLTMRTVLVLRDVAGLSPAECGRVVPGSSAEQTAQLDQARAAFVAALDDERADEVA